MNNRTARQSFNVDDIRRIREKSDVRFQNMTSEEISKDIRKRAQIGYSILEKLRCEKEKQQCGKHFL